MIHDPGIAFRSTRASQALAFLGISTGLTGGADAAEAIEDAVAECGLRSRRVILDASWWRSAGAPMLARLSDRRRTPRPADGSDAAEKGWVALIPRFFGGYRIRAASPEGGVLEWKVDGALAERLAPFAFTFHRSFAAKPVGARDLMTLAIGNDFRDIAIVLALGLAAALVGLLTPIATARLIDHAIPQGATGTIGQVIAGLAVAGAGLVMLDALRSLAIVRVDARTSIATHAAVLDRLISAPDRKSVV